MIDSMCRMFLGNPLIKKMYAQDPTSVINQIKDVIGDDIFNDDENLKQFLD
jgi:hypothetical protein